VPVITASDLIAAPMGGNLGRVRAHLFGLLSTERTALESAPMVIYHAWQTELRPLIAPMVSIEGVGSTSNRTSAVVVAEDLEQRPAELLAALRELAPLKVDRGIRDLLDSQLTGRSPQMTVAVACCVVIVAAAALKSAGRY